MNQTLHHDLLDIEALQQVTLDIENAKGLPNNLYTNDAACALERDTVLYKNWAGVGFASELPQKNYAMPINFHGLPLLLVKNNRDEVEVFHNVCSHRGRILVNEPGPIKGAIVCPYHCWSYATDGRLMATPHIGGTGVHAAEDFDKSKHNLKNVRCEVWMDIVFINLSGDAQDFADFIAPLQQRWQGYWGDTPQSIYHPASAQNRLDIEVQCNWKLAVENYCEAYHLPWVHPGLNSYSKLEDHYCIIPGDELEFAGPGVTNYNPEREGENLPVAPTWQPEQQKIAEYPALYPNVLLGLQADHFFVMVVLPIDKDRCLEKLRIAYVGEGATDPRFAVTRKSLLDMWQEVFTEDVDMVESMQQGRQSPGYSGGAFSPVLEPCSHHFQRWVARQHLQHSVDATA